jgi:integrase
VRRWKGGRYLEAGIGTADDHADGDGVAVLSYKQAVHRAMTETGLATQKRAGLLATVEDACSEYLDFLRLHRKTAADTQIKLTAYATGPGSPLRGKRLDALTPDDFRAWEKWALDRQRKRPAKLPKRKGRAKREQGSQGDPAEQLRKRQSTLNRVTTALLAALNLALKEKRLASGEAWRGLKKFRGVDASRVRWLSEDEAARLRSAAPADLRVLIDVALLTGLRQAEITNLKAGDFEARSQTVLASLTKSGKPRRVPLSDQGVALFQALVAGKASDQRLFTMANGQPWERHPISRTMRATCVAAKIEPCTFHELRHTYASHLILRGTPTAYVASALGHRDQRMVEKHYGHLSPSHVHETIRANLPTFGITAPSSNVTDLRARRATK